MVYSPWGRKELDMVERLSTDIHQQRGPQQANAFRTMCPNFKKIVRSFIEIVQRGPDQLVGILLMDWW